VIGRDNVFASKTDAIKAIFDRLDRDRCRVCETRIFSECSTVEGPVNAERTG